MQRAASSTEPRVEAAPRRQLWAEFVALFVVAPVAMAVFIGTVPLFAALFAFTLLSVVLLALTPGFRPRQLVQGPVLRHGAYILGFAAGAAAVCFALVLVLVPERLLELPRYRMDLWLKIMLFYPLISALPQEVIFRALFYRRYGNLFPGPNAALAANAAAFAVAHMFYQNAVAIGLTFVGGVIFALAYQRTGSFLLTVILHAIAGQIVFTSGLGIYFYHGAIGSAP